MSNGRVPFKIVKQDDARVGADTPGAVVVGGDYVGLGIVRSLGRHGIPVCVVDDEYSISRFSRFADYAVRVPTLRDEQATVDAMLALPSRLPIAGWVVFPTRDEVVGSFSRRRGELGEVFRMPLPAWETTSWAWDKRKTYALANRLGVPTPRTWYPTSPRELAEIDAEPPFAVKPAIKEHFFYATGAKAWRAGSWEELKARFEEASRLVPAGEVMVQELIPGDGRYQFSFCAFFRRDRSIASMVARRRRQHPPEFGRASTFAETVDLPVLEERSEQLLGAIDYYGLVEIEYKRDPRDGAYKLLDFNARAWGYHTLGLEAGVDFPRLVFADQLGASLEPRRGRPGVRWVRLVTDVPTLAVEIRNGRLGWKDLFGTLAGGFDVEAVFSREDPRPGLAEIALLPYLVYKRGF
jgi:predicted ATP-grasp superfamily ATP-dependent carboligase